MKTLTVIAGVVASAWGQYGTASPLEVLWTLAGLVGIYFTWHNLRDSREYILAVRQTPLADSSVKVIAFGHYRNELLRFLVFLVVIGVGVTAMVTPNIAQPHPSVTGVAVTLGLFMITAILIVASALDRRQRELLLNGTKGGEHKPSN